MDKEALEATMNEFPYYLYPLAKAAASMADPVLRDKIRARLAVGISDPNTLRTVIGLDPEEFRSFYPDMNAPSLSTEDTIESFLNRFGPQQPRKTEPAAADNPLTIVADIDYAATLETQDSPAGDADDETDNRISAFLKAVPPPRPRQQSAKSDHTRNNPPADSSLTRSLAAAMIKKHDYQGALQIITGLSLKNPEKSVYFADQIRFLRKLIINESKKTTLKD